MNRLVDALLWPGEGATLSLFAMFPEHAKPQYRQPVNMTPPNKVREYFLEDLDRRIGGCQCYEYDLRFDGLPLDLDSVLISWIESDITAGAELAWFGFEGSFHFDHILTEDVARDIFAVGTSQGIVLALEDDYREGPDWDARLSDLREQRRLRNPRCLQGHSSVTTRTGRGRWTSSAFRSHRPVAGASSTMKSLIFGD